MNGADFDLGRAFGVDLLAAGDLVDLTNCDREPIHVPGAIQPHGVMLVLHGPNFEIVQVSANAATFLRLEPSALLGKPLSVVVESEAVERVRQALALEDLEHNPLFVFSLRPIGLDFSLDAVAHHLHGLVILELEHPLPVEGPSVDVRALSDAVRRLERADSVAAFCQAAAREVRLVSGFDRVMVYRFDADGTGEVIAEERCDDLEPFLGLALSRLGHSQAGEGLVRAQPPAPDRRCHVHSGADAGAVHERQAAGHELLLVAQRFTGPSRVPGEHGRAGLNERFAD